MKKIKDPFHVLAEGTPDEERVHLLSRIVEHCPSSILITDSAGIIVYVNQMFELVSGFSFDEAIGRKPTIVASGLTHRTVYDDLWGTITAGGTWHGEFCNRKKNGDLFWEEALIAPILGSGGAIFFVAFKTDVTEKKQTEAMLLHSQKLEAIGILAGGIAHDFNNILTSILGFNHLILGDIENPDVVARHVQQIHAAGSRAKDLVRQILTFSRKVPTQRTAIDLCVVANEVFHFVRTMAPANVTAFLELPPGKAMVLGTTTQLHQALMNICLNAIDAIGDQSGTVSIVLVRREGSLVLSVSDTGGGIPPDIVSRLFDPFFTTKSKGSGLGLSVVHGIVKDLDGTISAESPAGGGARFVIRLPELASSVVPDVLSENRAPRSTRSTDQRGHVLVVDDDLAIVMMLDQFLVRLGYHVRTSTVSSEALEMIYRGEKFDIVITDQFMPDVTGIGLAREIAKRMPGTKVLLCSGRDDIIDYEDVVAAQIDGLILKPINLIELADTVESLLRGSDAIG